MKTSAEYQESRSELAVRERLRYSFFFLERGKRAGNCQILLPIRIAVLLEGQRAGKEANIPLSSVRFPNWKRRLDKVTAPPPLTSTFPGCTFRISDTHTHTPVAPPSGGDTFSGENGSVGFQSVRAGALQREASPIGRWREERSGAEAFSCSDLTLRKPRVTESCR